MATTNWSTITHNCAQKVSSQIPDRVLNTRACSLMVSDLCSETKGSRFESGCQLMWFLLYLYKCSRRRFFHCMCWWLHIQYFQLDSFRLVDKALSLCSCTFVRLDKVDFDVKLFYYGS